MCVAYISYQKNKDFCLCIAANRDEYYERPTQKGKYWDKERDSILGGKDLQSHGTWFAVHPNGKWALLTNYRDPTRIIEASRSRGLLVSDYLYSECSADQFTYSMQGNFQNYNGFNLIWGDYFSLYHYSNISQEIKKLDQGLYGLSNQLLDSPCPKVEDGKKLFRELLEQGTPSSPQFAENIFAFLNDRTIAPDHRLPQTGVSLDWERALSARFICTPTYGTRASTLFHIYREKAFFIEKTFGLGGVLIDSCEFSFPWLLR